eukprot:2542940-Amphidinium_carterae.1
MTDVPEEQVALEPEPDEVQPPPLIGENGQNAVQVVSNGATSRLERQERQDEEDYWENILEIMYEYFHDDHDIGESVSLHEGVLYWMSLDDIKDLENELTVPKIQTHYSSTSSTWSTTGS